MKNPRPAPPPDSSAASRPSPTTCCSRSRLPFVATFALLPLSGGEAILTATQGIVGQLYHALLVLLVFGYFGLCWTRSGQTLGMRAWRYPAAVGSR